MPKVILTFDAEHGTPSGDAYAGRIIDAFLEQSGTVEYTTANHSVVSALRLAIVEQRISHEDVKIVFGEQIILSNAKGELDAWPVGFCDHERNCVVAMMKTRRNMS